MKFEEVLPALKVGKKIRRNNPSRINSVGYIFLGRDIYGAPKIRLKYIEGRPETYIIRSSDLNANDWEVIAETKKVKLRDLTPEQFKNWYKNTCYKHECEECIFYRVPCAYDTINCWVRNKDLYSDKFLDQEIEIEG